MTVAFRFHADAASRTLNWDGERLFQAARFTTEMQYQHLVFEEFARKVQPDVDAFVFNPSVDINPAIFAEFAHVVYRFGHSMLSEKVAATNGGRHRHQHGPVRRLPEPAGLRLRHDRP